MNVVVTSGAAASAFWLYALIICACDRTGDEAAERITPEYDKTTGKLTLLKYDSNGNGKVDTWSYMDGARVVRIEIDKNEDGKIDRWEYYDANQKLEKIGTSRAQDGKEDSWSYPGADGTHRAHRRVDQARRQDHARRALSEGCARRRRKKTATATARWTSGKPTTAIVSRRSRSTPRTAARPTAGLIYGADGVGARSKSIRKGTGQFVAVELANDQSVLYLGCPAPERADTEKQLGDGRRRGGVGRERDLRARPSCSGATCRCCSTSRAAPRRSQIAREIRTQRASTLMFAVVDARRPDLTTEAVLAGMADVFARPLGGRRVANAIERELKYEARESIPASLENGDDLYGHSLAMRDVMALIARAAACAPAC